MNKKLINSFLLGATLVLSAGAFVSCQDYGSDINDLTDRVSAVEKVSKELQALIQKGSVITNVESSAKGVKVTLSSGETFEITNGTNGADGKDGKDGSAGKDGKPGSVVTIGSDGYWYIDGVKTEYKAQGEKGEKGDQGETGPQGPQGPKGEDGKDATGIYYYPGTEGAEKGFWVKVTVVGDNETKEVTTLRWAPKEEDRIGVVWTDGQLKLTNVKGYDGTLTIDLNTYLKALVFKPEMVLDGQNAMEYIYIPYEPMTLGPKEEGLKHAHMRHTAAGWTTVENTYSVGATTSHEGLAYLNPTYDKLYSLDPSNAIVPDYTQRNLGTVSQDPDFVKTRVASVPNYATNPAASKPTATFLDVKDGIMHVGITMQGEKVMTQEEASPYHAFDFYPHEKDNGKITDLAVTAPLGEGKETITSTWASVYASQMVFESLAYTTFAKQYTYIDPEHEYSSWKWDATKKKFVQNTSEPGKLLGYGDDPHKAPVEGGMHLYHSVHEAAQMVATLELQYDSEVGINLNKLVEADVIFNSCRSWNDREIKTRTEAQLKDLGMKFNFVQVPYSVGENGTEQTQNHSLLKNRADGTYIVACGVKSNSDTDPLACEPDETKVGKNAPKSIVGRTPLIRVELKDTVNNKIVEEGYIKFIIVEPERPIITKVFDLGYFYYKCTEQFQPTTWHAIEQKVLDEAVDMGKETFNVLYEAVKYPHVIDLSDIDLPIDPNDPIFEFAQWVPTGKVDIYGQPIFKLADKKIGHIFEYKEPDSETTNMFGIYLGREDFVNCVNDKTYPVVEEVRYIKFIPRKGLGNTNFNREPVYLPVKITFAYPKGVMANKIPKYWYADNSFNPANDVLDKDKLKNIHGNVEAPGNEADLKVGAADFEVYLDERFAKTTTGHTHSAQWTADAWKPGYFCFYDETNTCNDKPENAPSFSIDPEAFSPAQTWNIKKNFPSFVQEDLVYLYYFTLGNVKTVKGVSGKEYKLSVDNAVANSPVMLYTDPAKYEYKNTVLYANGTKIAEIKYQYNATEYGASATREHEAKLVVLNNEVTKDLINIPEGKASLATADSEAVVKFFEDTFDVELGVAVFNEECGAYLPLADNTFKAELLKPVYVEPLGPITFTDALDNGGNKVALYDLVKFYDWRAAAGDKGAYVFSSHTPVDLYKYYVVDLITVNPEEIMTDLSGEFKTLKEYSNGVEFQVYDSKNNRLDDGKVVDPAHKCTPGKAKANYDYLWYSNNTATVVNFNIKVPVRIHHKWSQNDLIVWVEGTVNRTVGN